MNASLLFLVGFTLAWPQDPDEARLAIAIVRKAEGVIEFDAKAPGKPVVAINL